MPKRVTARRLVNLRLTKGGAQGLLHGALIEMVASALAASPNTRKRPRAGY